MIFVSHRVEAAHPAARLGHLLGRRFGTGEVFLADPVAAGGDPAVAIDSALRRCTVGIVVIDPSWTPTGPVVRQVRTLFDRGIDVLPVLVDGAEPLRADDLPESVRGLARLRAVRLDHLTFRSDTEEVAAWVDSAVRDEPAPPVRPRARRPVSPDRPVPLHREIGRVVLWWMVFSFSIPAGLALFRLLRGRTEPHLLGAGIAVAVLAFLFLGGWLLALNRVIATQRLAVSRAGPQARYTSAGRATSRGRVRTLTVVCVVVAVLIGWGLS